ncbi:MAG TPA: M12 family metallo-peptidase [Oligoflexia bacterium]|nr:M12 family metallo-peptidase [Oligoflexia bacterium]HMP48971.1 M12 family metallo-peptidase [Oligoflexia bacterium]
MGKLKLNYSKRGYLGFVIFLLLIIAIAYPQIRSEESVYLDRISNFEFDNVGETQGWIYDLKRSLGRAGPRVQVFEYQGVSGSLEIFETGSISTERSYKFYPEAVTMDGQLVAAVLEDNTILSKNSSASYSLVKLDRVRIPHHVYEHEELEKHIAGELNSERISNSVSNIKTSSQVHGSALRIIEFHAFIAEDFASNSTQDDLVNEILSATLFANTYLQEIGFMMIPKGITIYRESSPFSSAIAARDPYEMLARAVDEHHSFSGVTRQLSVVFSRTFFPRAAGLAYTGTSCVNPRYSGIFVTQGGTSLSQRVTLPSTLAHEVGHYLGMNHDAKYYQDGFSVMAPSSNLLPFGYSATSVYEQRAHSSNNSIGGACFTVKNFGSTDTDNDGVSDLQEIFSGTDPLDAGSNPRTPSNEMYTAWNGFIGLASIGEIVNRSGLSGQINLLLKDINGNEIANRFSLIGGFNQSDVIFNELSPIFQNSYGSAKISALTPISGRANVYAHTGQFNSFRYITSQPLFKPFFGNQGVYVLNNAHAPESISEVMNWLSLINLSNKEAHFKVTSYNINGIFNSEEIVTVPAGGRRDINANSNSGDSLSGLLNIKPIGDQEIPFYAFISRYYKRSDGSSSGSVILDAEVPTGAPRYIITHSNETLANTNQSGTGWIELANSSDINAEVFIKFYHANGSTDGSKSIFIAPKSQAHIPFNFQGLIEISSNEKESLIASAIKYNIQSAVSTSSTLPLTESIRGEVSGSYNTFLSTTSRLLVANPEGKEALLNCRLHTGSNIMKITRNLGSSRSRVIDLKELFPFFPENSYAPLTCALNETNGVPLRGAFSMLRLVDGKHSVYQQFN